MLQQQKIRDGTSFAIKLGDKNAAGQQMFAECLGVSRIFRFFWLEFQGTLKGGCPFDETKHQPGGRQVAYDDKPGPYAPMWRVTQC